MHVLQKLMEWCVYEVYRNYNQLICYEESSKLYYYDVVKFNYYLICNYINFCVLNMQFVYAPSRKM